MKVLMNSNNKSGYGAREKNYRRNLLAIFWGMTANKETEITGCM